MWVLIHIGAVMHNIHLKQQQQQSFWLRHTVDFYLFWIIFSDNRQYCTVCQCVFNIQKMTIDAA